MQNTSSISLSPITIYSRKISRKVNSYLKWWESYCEFAAFSIGIFKRQREKCTARRDMMDTFICGASTDALVEIDGFFENCIEGLVDAMKKSGTIAGGVDYSSEKNAACIDFREKVSEYLAREHTKPLRNVIGMLSVGELAEIAETLVSIESLKERVTRPTESVSGPIDVAVISKSDGFIWIKRKHYFDPGLNSRLFAHHGIPGTKA